jgi:ribosomal protein L32
MEVRLGRQSQPEGHQRNHQHHRNAESHPHPNTATGSFRTAVAMACGLRLPRAGVLNRWGWKDRRNLRGNRVGHRGNCSSFKPSPRRRRLRRIHEWLKLISIDQSCKVIRGRHFIDPMARSSGDHCFWQARWVEISPPHRYAETTEPTPIVPAQGRTFSGTESAPFVPPRRRRASSQRCR